VNKSEIAHLKNGLEAWVNKRLELKDCNTLEEIFHAGQVRDALQYIQRLEKERDEAVRAATPVVNITKIEKTLGRETV
jgi:hypothetical protein